jgi:L-aspartate oxidase
MKTVETDFLVIGSGIAGLTFAIHASKHGTVEVVTKSSLVESNTNYAQGGMAAAIGEDDSWELHEEDTLSAGAGLCDPAAVRMLVQMAPTSFEWLVSLGANFDFDVRGISLTQEGGHSRRRIVHHADTTGAEIERTLTSQVMISKKIRLHEYTYCSHLMMDNSECVGAIVRPSSGEPYQILSRATLIATGSCCRVYRFTTNPPIATGDGLALASSVGATIENMEFIQFHPTTLYHREMRGFLLTEAIRGEGGILRTVHGRRFMQDYDPRGDLAPRDIVARAIHAETLKSGIPYVHLDVTHLAPGLFAERFPNIFSTLLKIGIDPTIDPIPVVPAAHYQCGGIKTDLQGKSSIERLYAAGEVASTGVHGANRLASNSLLEAIVFSTAAAKSAIEEPEIQSGGTAVQNVVPTVPENEVEGITRRLRRIMWEHVAIVRKNRGLQHAIDEIYEMINSLPRDYPFYLRGAESANLLECGKLITQAAINRKINVGLHYNLDLGPPWEATEPQVRV